MDASFTISTAESNVNSIKELEKNDIRIGTSKREKILSGSLKTKKFQR